MAKIRTETKTLEYDAKGKVKKETTIIDERDENFHICSPCNRQHYPWSTPIYQSGNSQPIQKLGVVNG